MKFFLKLLLKAGFTLGVMFVGYKFILSGGSGFQIPGLSGITDDASEGISELGNAVMEKDVTVYQWVDDEGVTHFGGIPPTGQGKYEKKQIRANTNVMQAYKAKEEEKKSEQRSLMARVGSVYSPKGAKDMMDNTSEVSEQMNERMAEQEKILNEIMNQQVGGKKK